jgi:hypothetical protein
VYLVNYLDAQTIAQQYIATARFRTGQVLLGTKDGVNVIFTIPFGDKFTHNLPFLTIQVYYNGQRILLIDDYTIAESGGFGTGYDTVIMEIAPLPTDKLWADYIAIGSP